jgi:uncharacterized protein (DUF427 family)
MRRSLVAATASRCLTESGRPAMQHGKANQPHKRHQNHYQEHHRKHLMKAIWNGAVIAQSDTTEVVEGNHYFPENSLNRDYVTFSNHHTMCSWKGQASYYSLLVNGEMNTDAAWYYPDPTPAAENIKGHVAFWKGVKIEA